MKAISGVWSRSVSTAAVPLMAIAIAGCSGSGTPSGTGPTITSAPETTTTVAAAIANPRSGVEFRSPSGNINCEIDNGSPYPDQRAFCFSAQPPQSATMASDGIYRACTGLKCLANPAMNEVVLPYGQKIALAPFVSSSSTTAMTCTAGGKGFEISRSGIASI